MQARKLKADRLARNKKLTDELKKLEKERDNWTGYLDGRKTFKWDKFVPEFRNKADYDAYCSCKKQAPKKIKAIDQQMATLRAQFEK